MSGVPVTACTACGWRGFPARIWCPACGSEGLEVAVVATGVLEERTSVRKAPGRVLVQPVALATAALTGGGRVVARLEGGAGEGEVDVDLEAGAPVARPGAE